MYVHFGSYGTACLDTATGEVLWKRDDLPCRHYRGPSSSVVLFENLVILTLDGVDLQYVVALDKETGKTVWKTDRDVEWNDQNLTGEYAKYADMAKDGDFRKAHSTPLFVAAATAGSNCSAPARRPRSPTTRAPATNCGAFLTTTGPSPRARSTKTASPTSSPASCTPSCGPSAPTAPATSPKRTSLATQVGRRQNRLAASGRRPDLHGQRRRHRQLHRRRHGRHRLAKTHRRRDLPPRPSMPTAASTSATRTAKPPSSNRAANSKSSPPTRSTTAAWPRRRWMEGRISAHEDASLSHRKRSAKGIKNRQYVAGAGRACDKQHRDEQAG